MQPSRLPPSPRAGFALLEVLVAILCFSILTVGILALANLGTRTSLDSERRTVAQGLINEWVEAKIRTLAYDDVGYTDATPPEPDGQLTRQAIVMRNNQPYTVSVVVTLIDDPLNGTVPTLNEATADYKQVQVTAAWRAPSGASRQIYVVTFVTRAGAAPLPTPTFAPLSSPSPPTSPSPLFPR